MPELPDRKVGIVACCGEEIAEGTVSRLATLKVLHDLRPDDTVTICLPLFVAGDAGECAFARVHPTIAVDGCDLRCAARATEALSGKPAASLVVSAVVAEQGLAKPEGRRRLDDAGKAAVEATATRLAALVDALAAAGDAGRAAESAMSAVQPQARNVACACGRGGTPAKASGVA